MARERWTDEQLDKSFDRIDADLREVRVEMRRGFERVDDRFDALQRNMTLWFISLFSTIVVSLITGLFAVISLT